MTGAFYATSQFTRSIRRKKRKKRKKKKNAKETSSYIVADPLDVVELVLGVDGLQGEAEASHHLPEPVRVSSSHAAVFVFPLPLLFFLYIRLAPSSNEEVYDK